MRIARPLAGIAFLSALLFSESSALANPPNDDLLNPQPGGRHLTLMPFVGPGFRAIYDERIEIEKDMSEIRAQVMGTVAIPFAEVSANLDARFFLMNFGGSVGYHTEWHLLQFTPGVNGRDRAGQPELQTTAAPASGGGPRPDPTPTFTDLDRNARSIKDQNVDFKQGHWAFEEARWGFVWPGYHFTGVSTLAARHEDRPAVTYDWENATVLNGGWNLRWEGILFYRARNFGFIGPTWRAMYVPRNRVRGNYTIPAGGTYAQGVADPAGQVVLDGSACQPGVVFGMPCVATHEFEFQYGIVGGLNPNWVTSSDVLLIRALTTAGFKNNLFGTQVFRQPLQIIFAYMVNIDL